MIEAGLTGTCAAPGQPRRAHAVGVGHQHRHRVARHLGAGQRGIDFGRQVLGRWRGGPATPARRTGEERAARARRAAGCGAKGIGRLSRPQCHGPTERGAWPAWIIARCPPHPAFLARTIGIGAAVVTVLVWTAFIVIARASAGRSLTPFDIAFARICGASLVLHALGRLAGDEGARANDPAAGSLFGLSPLPLRITAPAGVFGGLAYALLAYTGFFLRRPPMPRC